MKQKLLITKRNMAFDRRRSVAAVDDEDPNHKESYQDKQVLADWRQAMRLATFYENHVTKVRQSGRQSMIMPRDTLQILTRMRSKRVYVCEEDLGDETKIWAASLLWEEDLPLPDSTEKLGYRVERFWEIGTQVSDYSGLSLQWALTAFTIFEMFIIDASGVLYAATYGDNKQAPAAFLDKMKFQHWRDLPRPVEALRYHHLETGEEDETSRGVLWFRPTLQTVIEAAKLIQEINSFGYRTTSERSAEPGKKVGIEFAPQQSVTDKRESVIQRQTLDAIAELAAKIVSTPPATLSELRALGTGTISDEFLQLSEEEAR
ncbi:MAG: hypothetical protein JXR14_02500 [Paracoccaceae bacterium]